MSITAARDLCNLRLMAIHSDTVSGYGMITFSILFVFQRCLS